MYIQYVETMEAEKQQGVDGQRTQNECRLPCLRIPKLDRLPDGREKLSYFAIRRNALLRSEEMVRAYRKQRGKERRKQQEQMAVVIQRRFRKRQEQFELGRLIQELIAQRKRTIELQRKIERQRKQEEEQEKYTRRLSEMPECYVKQLLLKARENLCVNISRKQWEDEGAKILKVITCFPRVTRFEMVDCKLGSTEPRDLGVALGGQMNLRVLHIEKCNLRAKTCAVIMRNIKSLSHSIEVMKIPSNWITRGKLDGANEVGNPIFQQDFQGLVNLRENIKIFPRLRELDLSSNWIGANGLATLLTGQTFTVPRKSLQDLDLGKNNLGLKGAQALSQILIGCPCLETLRCGFNAFDAECLECLLPAITRHRCLHHLDLQGNKLEQRSSTSLAEIIKNTRTIRSLNLKNTDISIANCCQAILFRDGTERVDLSGNDIGKGAEREEAIRELCRLMAGTRTLKSLRISNINLVFPPEHQPRWPKMEARAAFADLAKILQSLEKNASLQVLEIRDPRLQRNPMGERMIQASLNRKRTAAMKSEVQRMIAHCCTERFVKVSRKYEALSPDQRDEMMIDAIMRIIAFAAPRRIILYR